MGQRGRTMLAWAASVALWSLPAASQTNPPNVYALMLQAGVLSVSLQQQAVAAMIAANNAGDAAQAAAYAAQINDINNFLAAKQQSTQGILAVESMIASAVVLTAGIMASVNMAHAASCPVFVGEGTLLGEDTCLWTKVSGEWANQHATDTDAFTWRIGGQAAVAPGWYLGGTLAAVTSWTDASPGTSGRSQGFDSSVALKYLAGPWLFTGMLGFATNWTHTTRPFSVAGASPLVQGDFTTYRGSAGLRAAYDIAFGSWYLRPRAGIDVSYLNVPAFQETGTSVAALSVSGRDKAFVILSPALEAGARLNVGERTVLRAYGSIGASFVPDNSWTIDASLSGPLAVLGNFRTTFYGPTALAVAEAGLQLYETHGSEVRAEYKLMVGDNFLSQTASLRLAYHF